MRVSGFQYVEIGQLSGAHMHKHASMHTHTHVFSSLNGAMKKHTITICSEEELAKKRESQLR